MQLRIARLTKPHGLKGGLKIELYTDEPDRRLVPGALFDLQVPESSPWHGRTLTLHELRWYNGHPVAFFEGIDDRNAAETVTKAILTLEQDPAVLPEESDAWYDHQLVGLTVVRDERPVGKVVRVEHLPAQDLLVIEAAQGEVLLPFLGRFVPEVDLTAGRLTVTPPGGLFEEADDGDDQAEQVDDQLVESIEESLRETAEAEAAASAPGEPTTAS